MTNNRLRVFVAGAYSSDTIIGSLDNMRRGMRLAYNVLKAGYAPFTPWFDYHFALIGEMTIDEYRDYSLAWLRVSDAILVVKGWENSEGTKNEIKYAGELGIPVFYDLGDLVDELFGITIFTS